MRTILALVLALSVQCACQSKPKVHPTDAYIDKQLKIIEKHKDVLAKQGRMPVDFSFPETVLAQYSWHSFKDGLFGAYTFYEPAFQQAQKSWWIHGFVKKGSDVLIAVNKNAQFKQYCRSVTWNMDGTETRDCDPPMNSMVGYQVGSGLGTVVEVIDDSTLRLDRKATADTLRFDLSITPPDYEDMCACHGGQQ
jgi:hypothetical protein